MKLMRKKEGFTLVEIMIVVAIIALLAAIAVPSFVKARTKSQDSACVNNLRLIEGAKDQYGLENDNVAATLTNIVPDYLKAAPDCPAGGGYTIGAYGVDPICSVGGNHAL